MRCPRCGNENPATNRFCGMCGTSLLQTPSPVPSPPQAAPPSKPPAAVPAAATATSAAATTAPAPATGAMTSARPSAPSLEEIRAISEGRASPARSEEEPLASVPSFLGLNEPAPARRRSSPLSIDPHAGPSSGNLDYLLEDEEEHKGGGGWKFILIVIALALAAGFGYLRWKNQSVPRLGAEATKPSAAAQTSNATDTSAASPSPSAASPASGLPLPAAASPGATDAAANPGSANPASASPPAAAPPATTPAASSAPSSMPPTPSADAGTTAAAQPAAAADTSAASSSGSAPAPAVVPPKPSPVEPLAKPHAALPAADPVERAQRYIYGKGVRQDCERGMRLLKPAVDQGNAKAMIEMGALYSAGLCTPRDLPTAYRWFALALRKDPSNESLQADLNKLWGEMTQPERQLAIRLSQ